MLKGEKEQKEDLVEEAKNAVRIGVCHSVVLLVPKGKKRLRKDLAERANLFQKTEKPLKSLSLVSSQTVPHILPPHH
jgi:hypothetical protein